MSCLIPRYDNRLQYIKTLSQETPREILTLTVIVTSDSSPCHSAAILLEASVYHVNEEYGPQGSGFDIYSQPSLQRHFHYLNNHLLGSIESFQHRLWEGV